MCVCVSCFCFNFPISSCVKTLSGIWISMWNSIEICSMSHRPFNLILNLPFLLVASIFLLPFSLLQKKQASQSMFYILYINRHFIQVMFPPLPLPPPACCVRLGAMTNSKHSWQVYKHIKHILIHSNINMVCVWCMFFLYFLKYNLSISRPNEFECAFHLSRHRRRRRLKIK